jgi:hypothetical protein
VSIRLHRPRYADVAATLALLVSMSGTAYAASTLARNSVDTKAIQNGAVTAPKIAANAINSARVIDGSLTGRDVSSDSITLADIAGAASNGSISLNGIPNGRCSQVTFNSAGARVGDSVIITTGAAIQVGVLLYPNRVASAGHIEVNACNFSGTTLTPISGFPVRIVTFR